MLAGSDAQNRVIGATTNANTRGRITSSGPELFIHNGANTLTINADLTGTTSPVFTSGGTNAGATIVLNNANSYVGTAYAHGVILNLGVLGTTSTTNAITGDLIATGATSTVPVRRSTPIRRSIGRPRTKSRIPPTSRSAAAR